MMPWPVKVPDLPPGALVLGQDGITRQGWWVPPATLILLNSDGSTLTVTVPPETTTLMMVENEAAVIARAVAILSAVFGPVQQIPTY